MHLVSERRDHRLVAVASALIALAFVAMFAFAARAQAAETIYWNNYDANNVAFADITGSGGGLLNLAGTTLESPEGLAYDSAAGRLYVASSGEKNDGGILFTNLDGSAAGSFSVPGAPVEAPEGIAVNPVNRTLYWANAKEGANTIGWARLDGSAGGTLNTSGTTVESPYRLAVDPVHGKVYWFNTKNSPYTIGYANADNSGGGGTLDLTGATPPTSVGGLVVDPAGNRLYWLSGIADRISYVSLSGGGGGDIDLSAATYSGPYGLALDPSISRLYWGNYSQGEARDNAIGYASTSGGGIGGISPSSAPVNGPQDPLIIKSPSGTGAPVISKDAANPALLTCPTGSWAADYAGSFVYQEPRSFGYQWLLNGAAIAGATSNTLTAAAPGAYTCTVTATNPTGSASQTSGAAATVNVAKVKLTVKPRKAKAKAGKLAKFQVQALNQGDLATGNAKVCVKVPKKAKKALKAPKCKKLGVVGALTKKNTTLKVKVKPTAAAGSYKVKLQVKGTAGKVVKATVKVLG
jgi:DNA-binding beta-propeller fold protein YncE